MGRRTPDPVGGFLDGLHELCADIAIIERRISMAVTLLRKVQALSRRLPSELAEDIEEFLKKEDRYTKQGL